MVKAVLLATSADAARLLISQGAVAMIGSDLSTTTLTVSTAAEQAKVPMLVNSLLDQIADRGYRYLSRSSRSPRSWTTRFIEDEHLEASHRFRLKLATR